VVKEAEREDGGHPKKRNHGGGGEPIRNK